jgi:long-chain acyl-CoA synthetase
VDVRPHLASLVDEFRQHPAETAVVDHRGNRRYTTTYGELAALAGRTSAELERRRIAPGERVVLWGENSAEWIGAFFGCLLRGVIVVPLDAKGSTEFATRVVQDVSPRLIVGDADLLHSLATEIAHLPLHHLQQHLPPEPLFTISEAVTPEAPFQIIFTSGAMSEPRGIVHTHRNVLASLQPIENEIAKYRKYERWVHPLRFLHTVPLSHVFGEFMGLWLPAVLAAELHFVEQFEPARMVELIRRERISVLVAVPRILQLLRVHLLRRFDSLATELQHIEGLSAAKRWWRFRQVHRALGWKFWAAISGGASLPPELEAFWNGLGFALIQGYGMTETAALVTLNHPFHIAHGTIGKALPGREVRISDEGEILVRGDMIATATWQNGAMRPRHGDWLNTGDLAVQEVSGELRFTGRKGDVIVTSAGLNIHPADLEAAMTAQPGVRACVVIPCDTAQGPEPVAVALFSGTTQELHTAAEQANHGLAEYQKIRRVLKWPEPAFPYTSTGKLLRRKVAQWACAAIADQPHGAPASTTENNLLLNMIAEVTGERPPSASDDLRLSEDLHLDSLGRVQLQSALERELGIELEDDAIASIQTLGQLRAIVENRDAITLPSQMATIPDTNPSASSIEPPAASIRPPLTDAPDHLYPHWPWAWPAQAIRVIFLEAIMRPLIWFLAAPRVEQTEALPQGPALVIANHVTASDGALVLYALPGHLRRHMAIAMSGEILLDFRRARNQQSALRDLLAPAAYLLITALFNVFPLPRLLGYRRSFAHAGEAMDRGYSVMIFPEGTRSRDGKLQPFRPGIGLLAQQSNVPIIPVALLGLGELSTEKARWFRSGRLTIRVGQAIPIKQSTDPAELTTRLEEALRQLATNPQRRVTPEQNTEVSS